MKLHQLKYVYEVANNEFNISDAAVELHTSQPGISKQIRMLEEELGVSIFTRNSNRLLGLTPAGKEMIIIIGEILSNIRNLRVIGNNYSDESSGTISIATTHTQARYALPQTIQLFRQRYPKVKFRIHQGNPQQIVDMVLNGDADLAIATEAIAQEDGLVSLPCYNWNRVVVCPPELPLASLDREIQLEDIAEYPLITYDFAFAGRSEMNKAFQHAGLTPNVVLTAIDADIIKTYVRLNMGIGLMAKMAYDPVIDNNLHCIDVSHLFEDSISRIGLRKGDILRLFIYDFIQIFAPQLSQENIQQAVDYNIKV